MRFGPILLMFVCCALYAQKQPAPRPNAIPLFTIKNAPVYTDEFVYLYKKNHLQATDFTDQKINEYIDLFINFKLKIAEARDRGLDTTRSFIKEYNTYKDELKKPYQANADDLSRLTREAYDHLTSEVKASHILIMVKSDAVPADTLAAFQKITAIRNQAISGGDFDKLAAEHSDDPSARSNGGSLGYFTAMQMVYPFEKGAYATKVGEISPVVRTRFGYHIIKVIDRRPANGEVEVSHIILRTDKGEDAAKVKNTIFEIYDQLKGGRGWDEICKEYSEDPNTRNAGGRLKPFGLRAFASSLPEFEEVAMSLKTPGEISDPFQTKAGWHIIRLEKRIPLPQFSEMEAGLKKRVARDERLLISKAGFIEKRKRELGFRENSDVKAKVLAQADSTLTKGKWNDSGLKPLYSLTLLTLSGKDMPVSSFSQFLSSTKLSSSLSPVAYMAQLYDKFIDSQINELEEAKLIAESPDYRMLLNEYKEGILLFEVMEKQVWNRASDDSVGQHKYYQEHLADFNAGNRVEAKIYATTDKAFLARVKDKIAAGDTLSAADLKKFSSISNRKVYKGKDSQVIDKISWSQGIHETQVNDSYYLVEVSRLIPPGVQTFEEARAGVISGYQDSLEKQWVKQLRKKYPVKVNKNGRNVVMAELKK